MKAIRNPLTTVVFVAVLALQANRMVAQQPTTEQIQKINAVAKKLVSIDSVARAKFAKENPGVLPEAQIQLPKVTAASFDWCNLNRVSDFRVQLTDDCWANAAIEALECSNIIRNGRRVRLSAQPVLDHLRLGAKTTQEMGGWAGQAYDFFMKTGTASVSNYPYSGKPAEPKQIDLPFRAIAWGYASNNDQTPSPEELKKALLKYGPLVVNLLDTTKFHAYQGGLYNEPADTVDQKDIKGHHTVLLVGWDDTRGEHGAWKIKNDWGPRWGEQGFMWIERGSNDIAHFAEWVMAESNFYDEPADAFAKLVPGSEPLPVAGYKAAGKTEIAKADAVKPEMKDDAKEVAKADTAKAEVAKADVAKPDTKKAEQVVKTAAQKVAINKMTEKWVAIALSGKVAKAHTADVASSGT